MWHTATKGALYTVALNLVFLAPGLGILDLSIPKIMEDQDFLQ